MWHPDSGTKIVLQCKGQDRFLAYQRDDKPGIPYPGKWDLIGGGVEPGESLLECAERELEEELGLTDVDLMLVDTLVSSVTEGKVLGRAYGVLTPSHIGRITFGSEGQRFGLFSVPEIAQLDFVPELRDYIMEHHGFFNRVIGLEQRLGA